MLIRQEPAGQRIARAWRQWHERLRSLVPVLFTARRPFAIIRRVRAVVVDAIDRMFGTGAWTHVLSKVGEGMQPTIADSNASAAIVGVMWRARIQAAVFHRAPTAVFQRIRAAVPRDAFFGEASTTARATLAHIAQRAYDLTAAIAAKQPAAMILRAFPFGKAQRDQSSIAFARYVQGSNTKLGAHNG